MTYLTSGAELALAALCLWMAHDYWTDFAGEPFWRAMSGVMVVIATGLAVIAVGIVRM